MQKMNSPSDYSIISISSCFIFNNKSNGHTPFIVDSLSTKLCNVSNAFTTSDCFSGPSCAYTAETRFFKSAYAADEVWVPLIIASKKSLK